MKAKYRPKIVIAANNGDVGGGEVMLLALAETLTNLGMKVSIVGPKSPSGLVDTAKDRGFDTVILDATTRVKYLYALRKWDRQHEDRILWCNGLLPAVAVAGHRNRVVHLHQRPYGIQKLLAMLARWGSLITLVPSADMAKDVRGSLVLHNWVAGVRTVEKLESGRDSTWPIRLGFLGRPSTDKGVEVLVEAMRILDHESPGQYQLVLAGEPRFVKKASRLAVERALDRVGHLVERTGWIEPRDFFGRVDVFVCPSIWEEPFGLVVAESMSARVPVVVSDAGALPEVVGPKHPWIAIAGDAEDLARVIRLAAEGDPLVVDYAYWRWESLFTPEAGRRRVDEVLGNLGLSILFEKEVGP